MPSSTESLANRGRPCTAKSERYFAPTAEGLASLRRLRSEDCARSQDERGCVAHFLPRLAGRLRRRPLYVGLFGPRLLLSSRCGSDGICLARFILRTVHPLD